MDGRETKGPRGRPTGSERRPPPGVYGVRLLRPEQAAEQLGISRSKVFELIASGELGSVKIARCRRVPSEALDQFISERWS